MTMTTREVLETAAAYIKEALDQLPANSPEVPETVTEWPEDDRHLQGEFWKDGDGDHWRYRNAMWQIWNPAKREWSGWGASNSPGFHPPSPAPRTRPSCAVLTVSRTCPRTWIERGAKSAMPNTALPDRRYRKAAGWSQYIFRRVASAGLSWSKVAATL